MGLITDGLAIIKFRVITNIFHNWYLGSLWSSISCILSSINISFSYDRILQNIDQKNPIKPRTFIRQFAWKLQFFYLL